LLLLVGDYWVQSAEYSLFADLKRNLRAAFALPKNAEDRFLIDK